MTLSMMETTVKKLVKVVTYCVLVAVVFFAWIVGDRVSASSQLDMFGVLITISSIIFAVMGAWLSLMKVEIMSGVDRASNNEEGDMYVDRARSLISPMSASAIILALSLVFVFFYYTLGHFDFFKHHYLLIRRCSFVVLGALVFWQFSSLIKLLFEGVDFLVSLSRKNNDLKGDRNR